MSWLHCITSHFLPMCSDCLALLLLVEQCYGDMGTNTQSELSLYVFLQLVVIHSSQINVLYWLFVSQPDTGGLKHSQTYHSHNVTQLQ